MLRKRLIQSNYFIGLCAFVLSIATSLLFREPGWNEFFYAVAVLFGTKAVYTFLRSGEDFSQVQIIFQLVKQEAIAILLAVGFVIASDLLTHHYLLLIFSLVICGLYGLHLFGRQARQFSLRAHGWLKLLSIGLVWTIVVAVLPLFIHSETITIREWLYIVSQFLFILALSLPFDMVDAVRQEVLGFTTVPRLVGDELAKKLARFLLFGAWALAGFASLPAFIATSISMVIFLKLINSDINDLPVEEFTFRFDGLMILQGLFIIGFYYLL